VNKDHDILYFVYTPVQSANYCDGRGRCFHFVCIYDCTSVFLCCYRFSVNKDLYKLQGSVAKYLRRGGVVNNQIKKGLLLSLSAKKIVKIRE